MAISAKVSTPVEVKTNVDNQSVNKSVGVQNASKTDDTFTINATEIPISLTGTTAANLQDAVQENVDGSGIISSSNVTTTDLTKLKNITATASELNQLDDKVIGGTNNDDIVDVGSNQTLSGKTIESNTYT
jgi:predicted alpha/beta hydrolase family esterase